MSKILANEKLMLEELRLAGFNYNDINHIHNEKGVPAKMADIILKWLPRIYEEHLGSGEHLVRSLISATEPFDPAILIDLFENSNYNSGIKWTIAYVLAISKTFDISKWLIDELLNKESSFERSGLLEGLTIKTDIADREELVIVLKKLFDKYCYFEFYLKLFKKYASTEDIDFLNSRIKNPQLTDYTRYAKKADEFFAENKSKGAHKRFEREISKAIATIEKRKSIPKFTQRQSIKKPKATVNLFTTRIKK